MFAFPWRALRISFFFFYSICKVNAPFFFFFYYSKDNKQFVFAPTLNLKPQTLHPRFQAGCVSVTIALQFWINGEDESPRCVFTCLLDCLHISLKAPMSGCVITHWMLFFFFLCVCVSLHKHFRPRLKAAALQRRLSTHSDATDDNSAIRLISGLYRPALVTNVTRGHNINLRDFEWLQSAVQSGWIHLLFKEIWHTAWGLKGH